MSVCAQCAQPMFGPGEFCAYHTASQTNDWATVNRLMCDFLHRGVVPATPHDIADPPIELLGETQEVALTA